MLFFRIIGLLLLSVTANAATINYISSESSYTVHSMWSGFFEEAPPPDTEYEHIVNAPVNNPNNFSTTVTGGVPDSVSGNRISGEVSGLNDTTGFSISGKAETWGGYNGSGLIYGCYGGPVSCRHQSILERTVKFSLPEETTMKITIEWSGLFDFGDGAGAGGHIRIRPLPLTESDNPGTGNIWESVSAGIDPYRGVEEYSLLLGPGEYYAYMYLVANNSGGPSFETPEDYAFIEGSVSMSAVPIPAAVWLFGSALAGLGWMRRKA